MDTLKTFANSAKEWKDSRKVMPVIFVGHGAPTYALDENKYSKAWREMGAQIPKPKAIVSISAHWLTRGGTWVTASPKPNTIHDFGPMDERLFQMQYPAPGAPSLANEIATMLHQVPVRLDHHWGLDHGTWCVLFHMYPNADIPVIQLSIDYNKGGKYHFELAQELSFLRKKGVLIICSGNIVHNLRRIVFQENASFEWAESFDQVSKSLIDTGDFERLVAYENLGIEAQLSIPTPDHYFPLLYALGLKTSKDEVSYPVEGIAYGATSMRSVLLTPIS